ncbi:hypothetical protein CCGE531_22740 (plasmid) [Rhizobium sp. CCGE531]|nr:hypothetical protein CCGE531_22740 [Rhizobium sp. CCGE531]AYG75280.1 hypothetical protein CCGE532_22225 [Rhizobium sp. CCGE532]
MGKRGGISNRVSNRARPNSRGGSGLIFWVRPQAGVSSVQSLPRYRRQFFVVRLRTNFANLRSRLQSAAVRYAHTILQSLLPMPPEPILLRQSVAIRLCRSFHSSGHGRF